MKINRQNIIALYEGEFVVMFDKVSKTYNITFNDNGNRTEINCDYKTIKEIKDYLNKIVYKHSFSYQGYLLIIKEKTLNKVKLFPNANSLKTID